MIILKHNDYIQQQKTLLDHVRYGTTAFYYVNPPMYHKDDFKHGKELKEVCEIKLTDLLDRYDFVESRYNNNIKIVHKLFDGVGGFTLEFWLMWEAQAVSEIIYINKWLKYWKQLYETVSDEKLIEYEETNHFTQDQIDHVKEIPIETYYQGELKSSGGKQVGLCPFHEENTPSFTIFEEENVYHCFGCQVHGDVIDFYMRTHDLEFIEAVKEMLRE